MAGGREFVCPRHRERDPACARERDIRHVEDRLPKSVFTSSPRMQRTARKLPELSENDAFAKITYLPGERSRRAIEPIATGICWYPPTVRASAKALVVEPGAPGTPGAP